MHRFASGFCAGVLLMALSAPPGEAGDAAVAKTLFEGGRKALRARKYDDAIPLFDKAWVEDPTLVEAVYWRAFSEEKAKDAESALESYREYLELLKKKNPARVGSEDKKLRKQARNRVRALAVAEGEFDAAEDKYLEALLAVMKKRLDKGETDSALKAARRILEVDPDHEEALAVLLKLAPDTDPFSVVKEWRFPIEEKLFTGPHCEYADTSLILDAKIGGRLRPNPPVRLTGDFGYETEFRILNAYEDEWSVGLTFGDDGKRFGALMAKAFRVELQWGEGGKSPQTLGSMDMADFDPAVPHRLGVLYREGTFVCWLDGKVAIKVPVSGFATDGDIGVLMTRCRVELLRLRAGRIQ